MALKTGQVSLSLSGAPSATAETAQVVLMDGTLAKIPELFWLGDDFEQIIQKNLVISFILSCLIIPVFYLLIYWSCDQHDHLLPKLLHQIR